MVSVIIPIFNVEPYLTKCVNSVLCSTYKDIEVILINDGATDGCYKICQNFVKTYTNISYLYQENHGPGTARNKGLEIARGEWIFFVDGDDWISPNAIEMLLCYADDNDCDIVQGGFYYAYNDHYLLRKVSKREKKKHLLSKNEAMYDLILQQRIKNFAWGKLYNREIIRNIHFPTLTHFEDFEWMQNSIDKCSRYGCVDTPLYYYRQRKDSLTGSLTINDKRVLEAYSQRLVFIESHYPELSNEMRKQYDRIYSQFYNSNNFLFRLNVLYKKMKDRIVSPYEKIEIFN